LQGEISVMPSHMDGQLARLAKFVAKKLCPGVRLLRRQKVEDWQLGFFCRRLAGLGAPASPT